MNIVRAKAAPRMVQQQSVIFLYFSLTGNCSGKITFSSNISTFFISLNKKYINSIKIHIKFISNTFTLFNCTGMGLIKRNIGSMSIFSMKLTTFIELSKSLNSKRYLLISNYELKSNFMFKLKYINFIHLFNFKLYQSKIFEEI